MQEAREAVLKYSSDFSRGIRDLKEEYLSAATTGMDYSPPDWTGSALFK